METVSDRERELRAVRNQLLFRTVNEQIRALTETFSVLTETFTIACECADSGCVAMLAITPEAYEQVRSHPYRFAVLPGHALPDLEHILGESERYVVVENLCAASDVGKGMEAAAA